MMTENANGTDDPLTAPVFVVGCPRSGTTLVRQMLDAHPAVAIAPETHFMQYLWAHRAAYGDLNRKQNFERLIDDVTGLAGFEEMALDAARFRRAAWQGKRSFQALFALLLRQYAEQTGAERVGEKTPTHVRYLPALHRFFPKARFVHVLRDARAVAHSWRGVPWSSGRLWRNADVWREHVAAARRSASRLGEALHTVRFERLVHAPEAVLRRLCRFLVLEFAPAMLGFHRNDAGAPDTEREPWKARATKPVQPDAATRWRDELSAAMVAEIEGRAWREMQCWGYAPETPWRRLAPAVAVTQIKKWGWKGELLFDEFAGAFSSVS
jgi:hypothetical protein